MEIYKFIIKALVVPMMRLRDMVIGFAKESKAVVLGLHAENERLRKALEFYARKSTWKEHTTSTGIVYSAAHGDQGTTARVALELRRPHEHPRTA